MHADDAGDEVDADGRQRIESVEHEEAMGDDGIDRDAGATDGDAAERDAGATDGDAAERDAGATDEGADDDESPEPEGVDTEHVMNLTFVLTLLFGVPTVVVLSLFVPLDGWNEILSFVVRVGAAIWFLTAVTLYVRERVRN